MSWHHSYIIYLSSRAGISSRQEVLYSSSINYIYFYTSLLLLELTTTKHQLFVSSLVLAPHGQTGTQHWALDSPQGGEHGTSRELSSLCLSVASPSICLGFFPSMGQLGWSPLVGPALQSLLSSEENIVKQLLLSGQESYN